MQNGGGQAQRHEAQCLHVSDDHSGFKQSADQNRTGPHGRQKRQLSRLPKNDQRCHDSNDAAQNNSFRHSHIFDEIFHRRIIDGKGGGRAGHGGHAAAIDAGLFHEKDQPPVTLIWRPTAGMLVVRSMTKSWPLGLRAMASSIAAISGPLDSEARKGARRSAASSCPKHI